MEYYRNNTNSMILQAALQIAGKGKPVFPCKGKEPLTKRGFYDATTNPGRVTASWKKHPQANIAVPGGPRAGFFVLDEDRSGALAELPQELPETLTVRTPSGGRHLYFQHVDGITTSTGRLPHGIDVRGEGGYVLVPPSPGYTVEHKAPIAPAPEWLLEKLIEKPTRPTSTGGGAPKVDPDSREPIPEGYRNRALASLGGRLRAFGFEREEIEDALLRTNAERCAPPLPESEVRRIAASVARYEPGKGTPPPDQATVAAIDAIEADLLSAPWPKVGGKSERSAAVVVLKLGRRVGRLLPDGRVEVSISRRALALAAATSRKTIDAILKRSAWLSPGRSGSGTNSGTIVVTTPPGGGSAKVGHSNHAGALSSEDVASGEGLRAPFSAPRLRWSAPGILRLGKSAEAAIDFLEQLGGSATVEDLAELLHVSRVRDFRRRVVGRIEERGIVTVSGDTVALVEDWLEALNREREASGEMAAYKRDMERFNRQREAYSKRHQNKPERAPSQEEMERERLRRVQDALDILQDTGTGPALILQNYLSGETRAFEYVVSAVAHYCGCSNSEPWREPVERAVELIAGMCSRRGA